MLIAITFAQNNVHFVETKLCIPQGQWELLTFETNESISTESLLKSITDTRYLGYQNDFLSTFMCCLSLVIQS